MKWNIGLFETKNTFDKFAHHRRDNWKSFLLQNKFVSIFSFNR